MPFRGISKVLSRRSAPPNHEHPFSLCPDIPPSSRATPSVVAYEEKNPRTTHALLPGNFGTYSCNDSSSSCLVIMKPRALTRSPFLFGNCSIARVMKTICPPVHLSFSPIIFFSFVYFCVDVLFYFISFLIFPSDVPSLFPLVVA